MTAVACVALGLAVTSLLLALLAPPRVSARVPRRAEHPLSWIRRRRRARAIGARSVHVLRATQGALQAGLPLAAALRSALTGMEPLREDPFVHALRAFELNAPIASSLRQLGHDAMDRRSALALEALAVAGSEPLPAARAAAIVGSVADRLSFEEHLADEISARTSGIRGQIVLLALLVPGLSLYLVVTLPGLGDTLASPIGRFVLVPLAIVFEIGGILASRAIVRSVS